MITIDLSILNQKGTPMFYSDIFAARPPFGIAGRIFISTDTKEFYRDTGTAWELLAGPGGGTITGSGTTGTLPIFTGSSTIGDSSLLEGASKFTTTKDFQADAIYLNSMTGGAGALYYSGNRLTLANYNAGGDVMIEANSGASAQFISGTNLSTTFYGNIIRNGGLSTQFLKADGSLDSTAYQPLLTNPVTGTGAATQVAFWSSGTALSGNNDLWWDNSNSRLGIGNNTPATQLDIHGNNATIQIDGRSTSSAFVQFVTQGVSKWRIGNLSPSNYFQIYDNANSLERIKLENTGLLTLTGNMTNVLTQTATGGSGWYGIFSNENITIPASTTFSGGNSFSSVNGKNGMTFAGSATFGLDNVPSGILSTNILSFSSAGSTITINQAGGVRAMSAITAFNQINSTNNGTISHIAGLQVIAPYSGAGTLTANNYYGLLLNASNERTAFTITNAWGIYQEGSSDKNYLNGTTLIGTNVDTLSGAKLQVNGAATITSSGAFPLTITRSSNSWALALDGSGGFSIYDKTALADRLYISSTGNLGLGVTPSAWGSAKRALQIGSGASYYGDTSSVTQNFSLANAYFDGTNLVYLGTGEATQYRQNLGAHSWWNAPSGTAGNAITFTQRMTLDASGNLGLGVTPSAWGSNPALQIRLGGAIQSADITGVILSANVYNPNNSGSRYISNGAASQFEQYNGSHYWFTAPSGTAGNAITFTQAMTLNASGNLGIGTATPNGKMTVIGNTFDIRNTSGGYGTGYAMELSTNANIPRIDWIDNGAYTGNIKSVSSEFIINNSSNNALVFQTNNTERLRITSSGRVLIGTTTDNTVDLLQVAGSVRTTKLVISDGTIKLEQLTDGSGALSGTSTNHYYRFMTNDTERMRINAAGGIEMKDSLKLTNFTTSGTAGSIVNYVQITVGTTNYLLPLYNLP